MQDEYRLLKDSIIEIGRRLWLRGMVGANDGNLSCRTEKGILITRSGVSKGYLSLEDILFIDGMKFSQQNQFEPSIETGMHYAIYENISEIKAIVHAHPPYTTAYSLTDINLNESNLEEIRIQLGEVKRIPYAPAGSKELAEKVSQGMIGARAGIMERHGAITVGSNLIEAYFRMEALEQAAKISFLARKINK